MTPPKTNPGHFFEDFRVGQVLRHATPKTITAGDVALYAALYGGRHAPQSSEAFARAVGYRAMPVDDLLVFHVVFGKTVPDVSLNAVANLGYAACRFLAPVHVGDTLSAVSEVIGLKENSNRQTGVVHVRSQGLRWVMVRKRDPGTIPPPAFVPTLPPALAIEEIGEACPPIDGAAWDDRLSGARHRHGDYAVGERIDHVDGMTVEEAEHMLATRLYQNTAKVHFDQWAQAGGRHGKRLVYGGHVISIARALSFNGLANAFHVAAINGGRHANPVFAGDTIYAWSEVLESARLPGRSDVGALRLRTLATKNHPCADFPGAEGTELPADVVLELDYWVLMPR
jgi:2-methylfumaryl-CoA hydratase